MAKDYGPHSSSPSTKASSNRPNPHTKSGSSKKSKSYKAPGTLSDPKEKDDSAAKLHLFHEQGATNIKNLAAKTPSPALGILSVPFQAGSRKTRSFFTDKVLGKGGYKDVSKEEFSKYTRTKQEQMYKAYLAGRHDNTTDAYGNPLYTGGGDDPTRVVEPIATKEKLTTDTAKKQEEIVLTKKQQLAKASGSGHGTQSTVMTSMVGDEDEANVAQAKLGGTIMKKKKKYG
jgi:hypothetical protein